MERPTGVTILAVLGYIGAGLLVFAALGTFTMGGVLLSRMGGGGAMGMLGGAAVAFVGVVFLIIAVLYVVLATGLLKLQNWARILTIVFVGLGLLFQALGLLGALFHFHPFIFIWRAIFAAIDVWILVYLLKPHVKQAFGATGF
jgi:hypothetical protein